MAKKRQIQSPEKAIRGKCLECSGGIRKEVELCPIIDCPLWPYRNGITKKEIPLKPTSRALWDTDIEIEE